MIISVLHVEYDWLHTGDAVRAKFSRRFLGSRLVTRPEQYRYPQLPEPSRCLES